MKYLIAVFASITLSLLSISSVFAHQSGCHSWHSCPSDTGSYVCGDLGPDTYCGGEEYYEEPDYGSQGTDNGHNQAGDDQSDIISMATDDGSEKGYDDGYSDSYQASTVDEPDFCMRDFTFDGYAPDEYQDAFYEAYQESCIEQYNDTYTEVYDEAYEKGQEENQAVLASSKGEAALTDSKEAGGSGWLWLMLIGGGITWYVISVAKNAKT